MSSPLPDLTCQQILQRVLKQQHHPLDVLTLQGDRLQRLGSGLLRHTGNEDGQDNDEIQTSLKNFQELHPEIQSLWYDQGIITDISLPLWNYWLPLAEAIAAHQKVLVHPLIQGILGGQGTGKTTLCLVLKTILHRWGIRAASLSIDDLYKTYAERQALKQEDPRLLWRGPPGTHDVSLGLTVIQQVLTGNQPIELPQFDKYAFEGQGDRSPPKTIEPVDVLLFEGWFVGTHPVSDDTFDQAPDPIRTPSDRQFARDMNEALKAYVPLWDKLDSLLVLNPVDYRLSLDWRWEAESKAIALGKTGMSHEQIIEFVQYFWKALHPGLFIAPLIKSAEWTDYVLDIGPDHRPVQLYSPVRESFRDS